MKHSAHITKLRRSSILIFVFHFSLFTSLCFSQTLAPGAPGKDAHWLTAAKQAVGTSATLDSKVWFTLARGVLTEVYYPDVTVANVQMLQFVVVNPKTKKVETEYDDAIHQVKVLRPDSLTFQQINTAKSGKWKITKTYTTDPQDDAVLIDVRFDRTDPILNLYVHYDPSIANSGMGDIGTVFAVSHGNFNGFEASDEKAGLRSMVLFSVPASEIGSAFATENVSQQLVDNGRSKRASAGPGNIVQFARIEKPDRFTTVIAFDRKPGGIPDLRAIDGASGLFRLEFQTVLKEYEAGWADYVKTLPKVDPKYQAQFNMAAMQLKAHEDKTHRGANIASMSVPWGGGENANEKGVGGYHLVWSRDLYQVFTAYMLLGDKPAAERALDFLFKVQQKPDGSFPQNSWLDGKPFWGSLQMDEVAYPLIMAYQLGRFDRATWQNHVKKAADFLVKNGPATPQERWEEEGGYSPSTIAAEIAGLVCAAEIAKRNGDTASAELYLKTADEWQANIEKWTATTTGKYGDGNYYLRITQNGKPDAGDKIEINNGGGTFDEREIVDAGFLELVRLGVRPPNDPLIVKSLKVVDQVIKVETPNGPAFYRYNHDGYGEMDDNRRWNWDGKYTGKGRLWALLSGERGQYELALSDHYRTQGSFNSSVTRGEFAFSHKLQAMRRLNHMLGFANEGLMIPEQIWDMKTGPTATIYSPAMQFGEGTGSATPLAWSMAQFIRLALNLKAGRNLDTPDIVYNRYARNQR